MLMSIGDGSYFLVDTIIVGVGHHGEDVGINIMLKWNYGQNINQCNY